LGIRYMDTNYNIFRPNAASRLDFQLLASENFGLSGVIASEATQSRERATRLWFRDCFGAHSGASQ
jgi:hypothetical protein